MNLYLFKARLLTFFVILLFLPTSLLAQDDIKITIKKSNISLQEALTDIEKQSKMSIAYNQSQLAGKKVSLDIRDFPLTKALDTVLKGTGFTYKLKKE